MITTIGPVALGSVFLVALALGAFHSLLPGHGKTLLAATHAGAGGGATGRAVRDAVAIAFMRVGTATLVALLGSDLARRLASGPHGAEASLGIVAGLVFVALGSWLAWSAWRAPAHAHVHSSAEGRATAPPLRERSVLLIGLVPDPVSLGVMIAATLVGAPYAGFAAALGLASGMAVTLSLFAAGGVRMHRWLNQTGALDARADRWMRLGAGIAVAGVGLTLIVAS